MAEEPLATEDVNWLFVDLNSYFASIEQELRPELRGQPIGVVPVDAETTCCIALSYQAKAYGLRAGISVAHARAICPNLILAVSRPRLYIEYHHRIAAAIERCVPIQQVMSCDEFACELIGRERTLRRATEIAYAIKQELRTVGPTLRCSIGLAPNRLLAKMAGDMLKPDGLMIFERRSLPHALYSLPLSDIPGVGDRLKRRLTSAGITTMRELCSLPRDRMSRIWGSVLGDRMWLWLRGENFLEPAPRPLQTLSRQHILAPTCRTPDRARGIAIKLLLATARRMRRQDLWAGGVFLRVGFYDHPACEAGIRIPPCSDPHTLQDHLIELWKGLPGYLPSDITVGLAHLDTAPSPLLFEIDPPPKARVTPAIDKLNARYGLNTVYLGSIHDVRQEAPTRIPFGPPPPLEEFNDTADKARKHPSATQPNYKLKHG